MDNDNYFFRTNAPEMGQQLENLKKRVTNYKDILQNTERYRQIWQESLRDKIINVLTTLSQEIGLEAEVEVEGEMENLESVVLSLGNSMSGLGQALSKNVKRQLIKSNGSLHYQQLFNGKVMVLINYPVIEGYGEPHPPKALGIFRPEELQEPFFIRQLAEFVTELTNWEDLDDDAPRGTDISTAIGFRPTGGEHPK